MADNHYSDQYNDGAYLENNPGWHDEDAVYKASFILQLLERHHSTMGSINSVCDVGCGSGSILKYIKEQQMSDSTLYVGLDISQQAITVAQSKNHDDIHFICGNLETLKRTYPFFDLALAIDIIEHIENYFEFLRQLRSLSSYTILHIPLDIHFWSVLKEDILISSKNRVGHIHNFTEKFITSVLEDLGFEIIDKLYTPPIDENSNAKQFIINCLRKFLFKVNKPFCAKTIGGLSILLLTRNKKNNTLT